MTKLLYRSVRIACAYNMIVMSIYMIPTVSGCIILANNFSRLMEGVIKYIQI
jgi:hypothetical protein